jgi:glycerophosphoryl diester phosphodiesterase
MFRVPLLCLALVACGQPPRAHRAAPFGPEACEALHEEWNQEPPLNSAPPWDEERLPWVAGRSSLVAPENTFYALDPPAAAGIPIEVDVWRTVDDVLVVIHDRFTTRTTGVALDVTASTYAELRTLNAAAHWDASVYPPTPIPTLLEVVCRYARSVPLIIEIKGDERTAERAAQLVRAHSLQRSVLMASFGAPQLRAIQRVEPSIRTLMMTDGSDGLPTPAVLIQNRAWGVSMAIAKITPEYVSACHDAGLTVFGWATNYVYEAELLLLAGIDGLYTDAPTYLRPLLLSASAPGTTAEPPRKMLGPEWRLFASLHPDTPAVLLTDSYVTFRQSVAPAAGNIFLIYPGIRAPEGPYAILTKLKLQTASLDLSNSLGVRFGFASDHDVSHLGRPAGEGIASNGYLFRYHANGAVRILRVTGGAVTELASSSWNALAEGDAVPLKIDVSAHSITVTRTDTLQSISAIDSTHTRAGFFSAFGAGQVPALGTTTITY